MFEFLYIRINKNLKIKMNKYDNDYKELINDILTNGSVCNSERTGTGSSDLPASEA